MYCVTYQARSQLTRAREGGALSHTESQEPPAFVTSARSVVLDEQHLPQVLGKLQEELSLSDVLVVSERSLSPKFPASLPQVPLI